MLQQGTPHPISAKFLGSNMACFSPLDLTSQAPFAEMFALLDMRDVHEPPIPHCTRPVHGRGGLVIPTRSMRRAPRQLNAKIGMSVGMELNAQSNPVRPTHHMHHSFDARLFSVAR